MDKYQLDESIVGPSLDRLVATEIMGNKVVDDEIFGPMEMHTNKGGINVYYPLRGYSNNIQSARMVVAKMINLAYHDDAAYWQTEDRPEVICKAALRAVLQRRQKKESLKIRANLRVIK
ncbi:hypothetical protein Dvar_48880 [Desulfosarcina variabilis str. Montpellier]|uniref:hypothetical protein n=1 Tax=Desulfosarcina variabilis TaxID=2300 RepID=UPI003AFA9892